MKSGPIIEKVELDNSKIMLFELYADQVQLVTEVHGGIYKALTEAEKERIRQLAEEIEKILSGAALR